MNKSTITITFGDQAENHHGVQKIGEQGKETHSVKDLIDISNNIIDYDTEYVHLNSALGEKFHTDEKAGLLIIRNGIDLLLSDINKTRDDLLEEHSKLIPDKQYYDTRRNKVLNKRARYNLCYSDFSQDSDFENKKGTIIHFDKIPLTKHLRERIPYYFGEKTTKLKGEGNYYYDLNKCGIGFHGDTERRIVIGMRLGESMPLHFQWYKKSVKIGKRVKLQLNHGDIYIMSKKAIGFDWKKRNNNILTLRHAAGAKKFLYP